MRVALDVHAIGLRQTGNETYIRNLADSLSTLALPDLDFHYYHTLPHERFEHGGWRGHLHRLHPHTSFLRIPISFPIALTMNKIDIAHFQYVAPPLCPCRTIVTIHDISFEYFREYFNPLAWARMKLLIPLSGRQAAHVITISEYSRQQLIRTYRLPEDHVSVTYLGVSSKFRIMSEMESMAATSHFDLTTPYILGVGNVQPRKNLIRLIRAFAKLRKEKWIPHKLVLVGQMTWQAERIVEEISKLGIGDSVMTIGYVTDQELIGLYNRAALFVYPSLYEGFGLPILEAMACGVPVVTSNVTCIPEVAGDAALLMDPLSEAELSAAMLRIIDNHELADSLKSRGLVRSKQFSWRTAAEQTAEIYARFV